jgi:uncharacterized protein YciI
MLIIDLIYKKPMSEVESVLEAHRDFLQTHYDSGLLVASGPKVPRTGGVIIALGDKSAMEAILKDDPFYKAGVTEYSITEFEPVKHCNAIKEVLS